MPLTKDKDGSYNNVFLGGDKSNPLKDKIGQTAKPFALFYKKHNELCFMFVDSTSAASSEMKKAIKSKAKAERSITVKEDKIYYGKVSFESSKCNIVFEAGTTVDALKARGKKSQKALEEELGYAIGKIGSITISGLDEASVEIPTEEDESDSDSSAPPPDRTTVETQTSEAMEVFNNSMEKLKGILADAKAEQAKGTISDDRLNAVSKVLEALAKHKAEYESKFKAMMDAVADESAGKEDLLGHVENVRSIIESPEVSAAFAACANEDESESELRKDTFGDIEEILSGVERLANSMT